MLGEAQVNANDLLAASLRMRPDRIILGELRGEEAFAFLRAINTGHPGSMTTVHADSPERAIEQIVLLTLQAGTQLSRDDVRHYIKSTVDIFVQLDPRRRPPPGRRGGVPSLSAIVLDSSRPGLLERRAAGPLRGIFALTLPLLKRLEAEAIQIIREGVAEAERPVMLFSGGKDSCVMLHLARKAFYPARPPFPLLHVDTGWKFAELYRLRDRLAAEAGNGADRPPQPGGRGARHQSVRPWRDACTPRCGRPRG